MNAPFNEDEFVEQLNAINTAAQNNALDTLRELHTQLMAEHHGFIPNDNARELLETQPISLAAENNALACVRFLLPWSDLRGNRAMVRAVENGYRECVELLLLHSPPSVLADGFVHATAVRQWECATAIFKHMDTEFQANFQKDLDIALLWSSQHKQHDFVALLYPLCDINRVLDYATGRWSDHQLMSLNDHHTAVQQHKILTSAVECPKTSRRSKI